MPKNYLIDINVFIRFFTRDDENKYQIVDKLLKRIKNGELIGVIPESIICEIVYVLGSKNIYHVPRVIIQELVLSVISCPYMEVPDLNIFVVALEYFATTNLDFEDCVLVARMERKELVGVISFDKRLDKITDKRVEVVV